MEVDLLKQGGVAGREDTQWYTQHLAATLLSALVDEKERAWLDIGAGLGRSRERITPHGFLCITQDPAPGLPVDLGADISQICGQFGVVSAFDVIEHIPSEALPPFLDHLRRLSSQFVVVSAPYSRPSKYHAETYTPKDLLRVLSCLGQLVCAYDLFDGKILRGDFLVGTPGAFGGLFIFQKRE
jgi:hypothetical protein